MDLLHLVECKLFESLAGCSCSGFGVIVVSVSFQLGVDENQGQSLGGNIYGVGELKRLHEVGRNDLKIVVTSLEVVEDIWKEQLQSILVVSLEEGLLDIGGHFGICLYALGRLAPVDEGAVVDFCDEVPQCLHVSTHLFDGGIFLCVFMVFFYIKLVIKNSSINFIKSNTELR